MNPAEVTFYIINLERSARRRDYIEKKLQRFGFPYKIVKAVDIENLDKNELDAITQNATHFKAIFRRPLRNKEVACAMSHQKIYQRIIADRQPYAVILEDDIKFHKPDILKQLLKNIESKKLTSTFDCILLGYHTDLYTDNYTRPAFCKKKNRINISNDKPTVYVGTPCLFYWGAYAYLVSQKGAHLLLQYGNPIRMPADMLTANAEYYGIKLGLTNIPLVIHDNKYSSDVGDRRITRHELPFCSFKRFKILWRENKRFNRLFYLIRMGYYFLRKCCYRCIIKFIYWGMMDYKKYKI